MAMTKEFRGKVIAREDKTTKGGTAFVELVIDEADEKYSNPLAVTCWGEKIPTAGVGDEVLCECFVNGREYNGRYYVQLSAKRVTLAAALAEASAPVTEISTDDEMPF